MQKNETLLISVLLLTTLAHVLDFVIIMPIGPKLMSEFSVSAAVYGNLVSFYTIAAAISSFLSTLWMDSVDRKTSLLGLLIGFSVGNAMCVWAPSISILMTGRVIAGIFGGVMQALVYSIISQTVSPNRQGRAAGIMGTAFPIVSIVGVPFGLRIADFFGWRMTFVMVLAVSFVAFVMAIVALPKVEPDSERVQLRGLIAPLKSVLSYGPHRVAFLLMFLTVLGGFTIVPYIAPYLINNKYLAENQLYLVYLFGGIFAIVSSRLIGGWADRFGKIPVLRVLLVLTMLVLLLFTNLPHYSLVLVLATTTMTMMIIPGRFVCVMAWVTTIGKKETRGAFLSLISTAQQLTIGLATLVGGLLVGETASGSFNTFWLAGIAAVTSNLLIFFLSPLLRRIEINASESRPKIPG